MVDTWDETKPAGSRNPQLGDDDIREFKRAVRERLAEDHEFESSESPAFGATDYKIGKHRYLTLIETSGDKTTLENEICVLAKDTADNLNSGDSHPELYIIPESGGTAIQITRNNGKIKVSDLLDDEEWTGWRIGANTASQASSSWLNIDSQSVIVADSQTVTFQSGIDVDVMDRLRTDKIREYNSGSGVTIDGLEIKDGEIANSGIKTGAISEARLATNSVSQAKLKDANDEVSSNVSAWRQKTFSSAGQFGFYPQIKTSNISCTPKISFAADGTADVGQSYATSIWIYSSGGHTTYARLRYISASGDVWWMFFLVDKKTQKRIGARSGQEHPCYGNGGKPMVLPHPFPDWDKNTEEIYVCNPSDELLEEIKARIPSGKDDVADRSILQVVNEDYDLDFSVEPPWPSKPIVIGFTKDTSELKVGETAEVLKKVIPQPDYIKTCGLKPK